MTLLRSSFEMESVTEPKGQNVFVAQATQAVDVALVPSLFVSGGQSEHGMIPVTFFYVPGIHGICEEIAGTISTLGPIVDE